MQRSWKGLMGIIGVLAAVSMLMTREAGAQGGPVEVGGEAGAKAIMYVVEPADTLWDIAARFLNSPYYWPKIWERNSFIINPNLIYPGDVINLYPSGEKLTPEMETVPKLGGEQKQPGLERLGEEAQVIRGPSGAVEKIIYKETASVGWIEAKEFEKAGKLIGTLDDHSLISQQDQVYVDVGSATGVKVGDLFNVFELAEEIRHPVTKKKLGYKILGLGTLEITKLTENTGLARIKDSYREMKAGDYIRPYMPPLTAEIPLVWSGKKLEGYLVANKRQSPATSQGDIVYIDLGKKAGVEAGNVLEVYAPGKKITSGREKKLLPDIVIGQLVVLEPLENTSVALVTESAIEFKIGERVRMAAHP